MLRRIVLIAVSVAMLGGCGTLIGGDAPRILDLSPKGTFDEGLPRVSWQLVVEEPSSAASVNTDRIAVRQGALEISYYVGYRWSDRAPAMIQTLLVESFENSGSITGVGRQAIGLVGDFLLKSELREFEVRAGADGQATVLVRLVLKLVRQASGEIVASTVLERELPSSDDTAPAVAVAFDEALGKIMKRAVAWTLEEGERSRRRDG